MNKNLLSQYGLKWNPFSPAIPTEACRLTPRVESFCLRVETLARDGGFALATGEPGTGKSVALRLLFARLSEMRDVTVGVLTRPQCSVADLYREMGEIFEIALSPHNRWAATKVLRERWRTHIEASLSRSVLLIDEAQELRVDALNELRLLTSSEFDSRQLLTVVLGGNAGILDTLRDRDLLPLASRIRVRMTMDPATPAELVEYLRHVLAAAGNPNLMSVELTSALADHAAGNLRALMNMGAELLEIGARKQVARLDEKLFFEVFSAPRTNSPPPKPGRGKPQSRGDMS